MNAISSNIVNAESVSDGEKQTTHTPKNKQLQQLASQKPSLNNTALQLLANC
jgi:flagellar basal body rod protein FlgC